MTGPVQVLVVGFDEPSFSGEVLAELDRLREAGIVRLVDLLLVARGEDGTLQTLPPPAGADAESGGLAAALLGHGGAEREDGDTQPGPDEASDTAWSLDQAVPLGCTAAVALIEHTWAGPLSAAIRRAGGRPLEETWLAPDDLMVLQRLMSGRAS